jgi:glutathione S-transferase
MCLAYGKLPYEDLSISEYFGGKAWPEAKPLCSYDQVPLLVVDGKPLAQSGAITRFAAGLAGLVPADPYAAAKADAISNDLNMISPPKAPTGMWTMERG